MLAYNLPGVANLILSRDQIVGIYNGTITRWNDSGIQALNADVTLPPQPVRVIARADKSGMGDNLDLYFLFFFIANTNSTHSSAQDHDYC